MNTLTDMCAPGTGIREDLISVSENVTLRVFTFTPPEPRNRPAVLFVSGWISTTSSWQHALREMTKDFTVHYVETREKASAEVKGTVDYSVETIGRDLITLIKHFQLDSGNYILFGSSLGATAILDCCRFLESEPLCLVLVGANAIFQVPWWGMILVRLYPPAIYLAIKPFIKWYLRTFRVSRGGGAAQAAKYARNLDMAEPYRLKKAMLALAKYEVWDRLEEVRFPALVVGASGDLLHDPDNIREIVSRLNDCVYLDLETNERTHSAEVVVELRQFIATATKKSSSHVADAASKPSNG
ncbi:MAG: alpha/beta hydrolase [Fidelibacterota bacterium]|nr:MAG: alpha/beta hydrolase [Candidatus Neomarinimicrobiota bacterium]